MGDSLGIMMTLEKEVHLFVNGVWRRSIRVDEYPLNETVWGVANVFGRCTQVKAEICSGKLTLVHSMCSHICSLPHSVQVQS